jgi:hypothetical protein
MLNSELKNYCENERVEYLLLEEAIGSKDYFRSMLKKSLGYVEKFFAGLAAVTRDAGEKIEMRG